MHHFHSGPVRESVFDIRNKEKSRMAGLIFILLSIVLTVTSKLSCLPYSFHLSPIRNEYWLSDLYISLIRQSMCQDHCWTIVQHVQYWIKVHIDL